MERRGGTDEIRKRPRFQNLRKKPRRRPPYYLVGRHLAERFVYYGREIRSCVCSQISAKTQAAFENHTGVTALTANRQEAGKEPDDHHQQRPVP